MRWLEVCFDTSGELAESASAVLQQYCAGGVALEPAVVPLDDQEGAYAPAPGGRVLVRGFLPIDATVAATRRDIEEAFWHLQQLLPEESTSLSFVERAEEDWAQAWKRHYHALEVGPFLVVPAWEHVKEPASNRVLRLDPGMAFGTGSHASTQLVLEALPDTIRSGHRVADVGTGSGILAIGAVLLGARHVDAVDVDPAAVEAAASNARMNDVDDRITVARGSVDALPAAHLYDVVMANIIASVIVDLMPSLRGLLRDGGIVLTAGIIVDREHLVLRAASDCGLGVIERWCRDDWVCLKLSPT